MEDPGQSFIGPQVDNTVGSVDSVNIKKICRVCLSQFDLGIPLFEPNESLNNTTAASLIWNCFGIKIQNKDKFPNQICNECSLNILISHNFKIQLQQSHKLLETQYADESVATPEEFRVFKIDDNLYRIKINSNENEDNEYESNETTKNYDELLQNLRANNKLKLENDDVLLIVTDDPNSMKSVSKYKKVRDINFSDVPRNLDEACRWLKLAKRAGLPYECKICNRKYNSRYVAFYMHVRLHFTKKVQCPLCPVKYFPFRKKHHMRKHTKEKPYICPNCNKSFTMRNHLNQHLKFRCDVKKESTCKICLKVFTTYKLLHTHLLKEHGTCRHEQNRNSCAVCKKESENKEMCEYCGKIVTRSKKHLNTCKSAPIDIQFQLQNATTCEKCGELLFSKYQINCHMKTHNKERTNFTCEICGNIFLRKQYLKDHMESHAPGHYPCDKCDKVFKKRLLLKRHKSTHQNLRKHICPVCSKSYKTKDHLNKHLFVHTKVRPFVCSICNKSFSFKGNLNQHLAVHNGVMPFACTVCNKTFGFKGNLARHMLTHEKSKITSLTQVE